MEECKAQIAKIETFGLVDGPGVRFVVFFQGCNMRCKYCHNVETWAKYSKQAKEYTAQSLFDLAFKYAPYWGKNMCNGGITVSGGEPLIQIDFLIEFFQIAKKHGVHTAIDTSGQPFENNEEYLKKFNCLLELTDLFIVDIKAYDENLHKNLTGHTNHNIFQMIKFLSEKNKKMWIRHVLIPNLTDSEKELKNIKEFVDSLNSVTKVEILPYHTLGVFKWKQIGIDYQLKGYYAPTEKDILHAEKFLFLKK